MINLKKYPVGEIRKEKPTSSEVFVVRVEKQLPLRMKGLCEEVEIDSTSSVSLSSINTKQRTLGYIIRIEGRPRVVFRWNYLYVFYGKKVSKVKIVYQDSAVRLTKSGNGKFVGFVLRTRNQSEELTGELEDEK